MADETASGPADRVQVLAAFRLGWAVAEVRGRARCRGDDPGAEPSSGVVDRGGHGLPLGVERSPSEQAIEARDVLAGLADRLDVDVPVYELTGQGSGKIKASLRLHARLKDLDQRWDRWDAFAEFLWAWDARIQDLLAVGPFGRSSAYQLGRGLAEVSWALDPAAEPTSWSSWVFLLGEQRVAALDQLLDRLAVYLHPMAAPAIKGSLGAWRDAARAAVVREDPEALRALRRQVNRWRDLVVLGQDPRMLAGVKKGFALARKTRVVLHLIGALWPQLLIGSLSVGVLVAAALLVPESGSAGAAAGIVGAAGVTSSTISARAKSSAQLLLAQAERGYSEQLAIDVTTQLPRSASGSHRE